MQSYFVEIAAVRLAARLMGEAAVERFPQYAYAGTLARYGDLQTAGIKEAEGIDDVPEKAASMRFGQHCARVMRIHKADTGLSAQADVLLGMFYETGAPAPKAAEIRQVVRSLLRRAQLQTHTAKPGYEDINAWLASYYDLQNGLDAFLDALCETAVNRAETRPCERYFSREDTLTGMALRGETLAGRDPEAIVGPSAFDRLLAAICKKPDFSAPLSKRAYQVHPDFPARKAVDGEALQGIIRAKMVDVSGIPGKLTILSIEMRLCGDQCLLITKTDAGVTGISIAGGNWRYFYPILQKKIAPFFIGTDARDLEDTLEAVYVRDLNYKIQGLAYWCCVSWLEASVLDILGKAKGVFVGELFGPRVNESVAYYCASGNRGTTPLEEIEILAARIAEIGTKAVKFKIGGRMSWDADSMAGRSEELIVLARKYFGDDMIIHADGNGSFMPEQAIAYGEMLEDIGAYFYEEPCRFDYLWETKEVADAVKIPLAFGEQETSLRRFQWLIENDAAQVLQPDVQYMGGFIRAAKVAKMAALAGIPITPHISGGIQYAHVLMLASFTPNMGKYQELKVGYAETKDFFTTELVLKAGRMNIPKGVGLGMAFDTAFLEKGETVFLSEGNVGKGSK